MPAAHARPVGIQFTQQVHRGGHHEVERQVETAALPIGLELQAALGRDQSPSRRRSLPGGLDFVDRRRRHGAPGQQGNAGIVQGFSTPPLMALIMLLTGDRRVMGDQVNGRGLAVLGWLTVAAMSAATVGLIAAWVM